MILKNPWLGYWLIGCWSIGCGQVTVKNAKTLPESSAYPISPIRGDGAQPANNPNEASVRIMGRVFQQDDGSWLVAWPMTTFEVAFQGTGLQVTLYDRALWSNTDAASKQERNVYDVWLDGQPYQRLTLDSTSQQWTLVQNAALGQHVVRLVRRTEAQNGFDVLSHFKVIDGDFAELPAKPWKRSFLFIGDSNLTGWGVDSAEVTAQTMCAYSSATQDAQQAYPALVAQTLQAQLTLLGYSGKGIGRNRDWKNDPNKTLPWLFERTLPVTSSPLWPHQEHPLDLIYINGGGNDFATETIDGVTAPARTADEFAQNYVAFIQTIRQFYPQVPIVLGLGPTLRRAENLAAASQGLQQAVATLADEQVTTLLLPTDEGQLGYACDFHPSRRTHVQMAELLVQHLRSLYPDW